MVAIARENTERLVRLVNDTLDLERLEAGRVDVDPRPVRPGELLAATAQVVQPVADEAGVELSWEADELELMVDPDRVVQALVNLDRQRGQVLARGQRRAHARRGRRRRRADLGRRRGARHPRRPARVRLRALPAGRRLRPAREGRDRARAGDLARDRRAARRPDLGRERAGQGRDVPLHAAAATAPTSAVAVYDRRVRPARGARARRAPARAARRRVRRRPRRSPTREDRFVAVLVAGARGLDELDARRSGARRSRAPTTSSARVAELLAGLEP